MSQTQPMTKAQAVLVQADDATAVAQSIIAQLSDFGWIDALFVFAGADYSEQLPGLIAALHQGLKPQTLLGCSGQGIIGQAQEIEGKVAVAVLALALPGAKLQAIHFTQADLMEANAAWLPDLTTINTLDINAWMLLNDPFSLDAERMLTVFSEVYPGRPLIGGLASGDFRQRRTYLFLNDQVLEEGALALAVGGDYTLRPVVSQGATPIGEDWMVTAAEGNVIQNISGRPAYEVLVDTFRALSPAKQQQARRNLLVGLAVDEHKASFKRGDFIIRNLMAIDPTSGTIVIGDEPRIGQTIQFQMRDAQAADEDLRAILSAAKAGLDGAPLAGLLFSCNGRGMGLFGTPNHDALSVAEHFGQLPLAGFFCNGEIGPVGPKNFLHGFTASLGLFVKK